MDNTSYILFRSIIYITFVLISCVKINVPFVFDIALIKIEQIFIIAI